MIKRFVEALEQLVLELRSLNEVLRSETSEIKTEQKTEFKPVSGRGGWRNVVSRARDRYANPKPEPVVFTDSSH